MLPGLWLSRSPDLTHLVFFQWNHLKELVYRYLVITESHLVTQLHATCSFVDITLFQRMKSDIPRDAPELICAIEFLNLYLYKHMQIQMFFFSTQLSFRTVDIMPYIFLEKYGSYRYISPSIFYILQAINSAVQSCL